MATNTGNPILIRGSNTSGVTPSSLAQGADDSESTAGAATEIAINRADGKLFYLNASDAVTEFSAGGLSGLGSTDNAILRANGTGGDTAQGSSLVIDDSANLTGANGITGATITASTKFVSDKLEAQNHGGSVMGFEFTDGFNSDDAIEIRVGNSVKFAFVNTPTPDSGGAAFIPWNDNDVNLGHSSYEFKNLYLDGTAFIDTLQLGATEITATGAELNILDGVTSTATELNLLDGSSANTVVNSKAVIYGSSGELAGTLSTAAQTNITSLGTLTSLTVDDVTINGSTISDAGDFTIDVEGDITVDANGGQIYFKDNGTTYWTFDHGSNDIKLTTAGSSFEIENAGEFLIDAAGDITLDAAGDEIKFADAGSTRFTFNLDSTPELDVTGNFTIDCSGDITLDAGGEDIFLKDDGTTFGTLKNFNSGLGILGGTATDQYTIVTDSSGNLTTGTNFPFVIAAGMTNLGTSSAEKLLSFVTTNGNTVSGTDPGDGFYNQVFTVPFDCKLVSVFGSFDQSITNASNLGTFTLTKAAAGSQDFSDLFQINETLVDPHLPATDWSSAGLGTAGTIYNFLDFSSGSTPVTGSFGPQTFSKGDKISGSMTVSSSVNTGIRGSFTFVFVSTGGLELAASE